MQKVRQAQNLLEMIKGRNSNDNINKSTLSENETFDRSTILLQ